MRAFFLSDLHLRSGDDDASRRFARFLREVPAAGDTLILGGDIFDLFVGNKPVFRRKFAEVLASLCALAGRGVRVYYLEGNHDFHVRGVFGEEPGVKVRADEFSLEWQGRRLLISHGDLIDPEDRAYRLLRAVTRHPLFRAFVCLFPGAWIDAIGNASSKKSREYNHTDAGGEAGRARLRRLYLDFARAKVAEGFDHVLVGHSHLRDQITIEAAEKTGEYVNLGFSARELLYACLEEGAPAFSLRSFT